jgi:DNA-binding MarR family transcriptional regulator
LRKEDIQELKLMEEVFKNEGIATQRELAQSLNISLGLVNAFIKRIVRKGYFKVATIPGRRMRYLLTPKGVAKKSRLTAEYLQYSLSYYGEIRKRLMLYAEELRKEDVQKVVLVGTGEFAELFTLALQQAKIEIAQFFSEDDNNTRWFLGYPVEPLSALKKFDKKSFDKICLIGIEDVTLVQSRLGEIGDLRDRIVVCPEF